MTTAITREERARWYAGQIAGIVHSQTSDFIIRLLAALDAADAVAASVVAECGTCRDHGLVNADGWHVIDGKEYSCNLPVAQRRALAAYRALVEPPK